MIRSKSHPAILLILRLNPARSDELAICHKNLFCQTAFPRVFCKELKIRVSTPLVGLTPDLLNCSVAGRLNSRSASMRVFVGRWQNTSSLFTCLVVRMYRQKMPSFPYVSKRRVLTYEGTYSHTNSRSNSSLTLGRPSPFLLSTHLSAGILPYPCLSLRPGKVSGPITTASGHSLCQSSRKMWCSWSRAAM